MPKPTLQHINTHGHSINSRYYFLNICTEKRADVIVMNAFKNCSLKF